MTAACHCSFTDYSPRCCSSSKQTTAAAPTCCMVEENKRENKDTMWLIIGVTVGAFVLLCIVTVAVFVCVVCCICRRRRRGREVQPVDVGDNGERGLDEGNNGPTGYGTFNHDTPTSMSPYSNPRDAVVTVSQEEISLPQHRAVQAVSGEGDSSTELVDTPESEPNRKESPPSTGDTNKAAMPAVADTAQVSPEGMHSTMPALGIVNMH